MPNIDIPVAVDLQQLFELPPCEAIKLPKPSPMSIQLPTGGSLKAFTDISKGIPTDCSMSLSLLLQVAPLLASMDCLLKILKLLKPLIDIVKGLPFPPVKAVSDFIEAAADLAPCLLIPVPGGNIVPFIRDILCLILKMLRCFLGQLKTVAGVMGGLALQLKLAQDTGNSELQMAIQCAQENAEISAQHLTQSIEPIRALLDLVGPLLGLAQVPAIQLPVLGSQTDVESLNQTIQTMQGVVDVIQGAVDAIGGCPP
jgi:hypothetical protein